MIRDGIKVSIDRFYPTLDGFFSIRDHLDARSHGERPLLVRGEDHEFFPSGLVGTGIEFHNT
jgi:hypothetical protein